MVYSTDRSEAIVPVLGLLFVVLWFILRGDLFYVLLCVIFALVFFSTFSIAMTSLGEERANLSDFRTFVRFVLIWFCRFLLPLGVWEGLRFVIVALPGLFSFLFFQLLKFLNHRSAATVECFQCFVVSLNSFPSTPSCPKVYGNLILMVT